MLFTAEDAEVSAESAELVCVPLRNPQRPLRFKERFSSR